MPRRKKPEAASGWRYEGSSKPIDKDGNEVTDPSKVDGWVRREKPVHRRMKGGIEVEHRPDEVLNPAHANGHSEGGE